MENENISGEPVTGGEGVTPAEASTTVSDGLSLKELSETFGTEFKTREDALKSIKETKNFVGKRKDDIKSEAKTEILAILKEQGISTDNYVTKSELEKEKFYAGNPTFKGLETVIEAVKKDKGISYEEVLALEELKPFLETKSQTGNKSVLMSSPTVRTDEPTAYDRMVREKNPRIRLEALADLLASQEK